MNTTILATCLLCSQTPFPLDMDFKGGITVNDQRIQVMSRVVKRGDKYVYMYNIKNLGKKEEQIRWTVLSYALINSKGFTIVLKPNESTTITMERKEPPIQVHGMVYFFQKCDAKRWQDMINEEGENIKVDFSNLKNFWLQGGGGQPGPVPDSKYLRTLIKEGVLKH